MKIIKILLFDVFAIVVLSISLLYIGRFFKILRLESLEKKKRIKEKLKLEKNIENLNKN